MVSELTLRLNKGTQPGCRVSCPVCHSNRPLQGSRILTSQQGQSSTVTLFDLTINIEIYILETPFTHLFVANLAAVKRLYYLASENFLI